LADGLKFLFLTEGVVGTVMGHATYDASLKPVLERMPEVEIRLAGLPEQSRLQKNLWRGIPLLEEHDLDMQASRWHAVHSMLARRSLIEEIEAWEPDVVQVKSHSITFGMLGVMKRVPVVPVVDITVWGWRQMETGRPLRPYSKAMIWPSERAERAVFTRAPMVLGMTDWASADVRRVAPEARVVTNHPGIDLERFHPAQRNGSPLPRVLFVGGRFESKGGLELIEALGDRLGREVELDVVTAEEVPEHDGITVHRLRNDDPRLVELYQRADVFCLPTHGDSNPWVVLEAMGCGTPVVASDLAGIPEMLGHGRAGVTVPVGDTEALRRELWALLDDDARREELGQAARAHVEEHFDNRKQVPKLLDLLREAAGRPLATSP
jgi:glycosyltransferase involved in cell wall biosynthesis